MASRQSRQSIAWIVGALVAISTNASPATEQLRPSDDPPRRVRTMDSRLHLALSNGMERSATFRQIVATLDSSDVMVYIEKGRCTARWAESCLVVAPRLNGARHLRIRLDPRQALPTVVARLAHELQHAVEIAQTAEVVDDDTLADLYRRIGKPASAQSVAFETFRAIRVADMVREELRAYEAERRQANQAKGPK